MDTLPVLVSIHVKIKMPQLKQLRRDSVYFNTELYSIVHLGNKVTVTMLHLESRSESNELMHTFMVMPSYSSLIYSSESAT